MNPVSLGSRRTDTTEPVSWTSSRKDSPSNVPLTPPSSSTEVMVSEYDKNDPKSTKELLYMYKKFKRHTETPSKVSEFINNKNNKNLEEDK